MKLLEPMAIGSMNLPNRVMVPAMVTRLADEEGWVTQDIADRYVRYAKGGVGLIVVEAMAIHHSNSGPLLRISDDRFIPGLAGMVERIHDTSDSKVVPQIIHFMKVARSGWRQTIDMLSLEDIDRIVEQFGDAVARAREAGFDGAELHSAHAYTLASFLSRRNPRTDDYGGTLEGRLHLIGRVRENILRKVGDDFPVGIRFLSEEFIKDGYTVNESKLIALRLAQLGFAYLSLSVGGKFEDAEHVPGQVPYPYTGYSGDRCMPGAWYPPALHAGLAGEIKAFVNAKGYATPVAAAGKISDPADAERVLTEGDGLRRHRARAARGPRLGQQGQGGPTRPHHPVRLLQRLQTSRRHPQEGRLFPVAEGRPAGAGRRCRDHRPRLGFRQGQSEDQTGGRRRRPDLDQDPRRRPLRRLSRRRRRRSHRRGRRQGDALGGQHHHGRDELSLLRPRLRPHRRRQPAVEHGSSRA